MRKNERTIRWMLPASTFDGRVQWYEIEGAEMCVCTCACGVSNEGRFINPKLKKKKAGRSGSSGQSNIAPPHAHFTAANCIPQAFRPAVQLSRAIPVGNLRSESVTYRVSRRRPRRHGKSRGEAGRTGSWLGCQAQATYAREREGAEGPWGRERVDQACSLGTSEIPAR